MANPTSNFGWQMPTNTDLVKDLPADFEVFGQAVDTSLMDLKGGTTGQVLSKASNTDMDFTWVTSDDANAIQNTIVDAKGDLISATGNDVPARLAVGNNGETLVADSSASTGLRWQGNYAAGKNMIINGNCSIAQAGTSKSGVTASDVLVDRFRVQPESMGTLTVSQETDAPDGFGNSLKLLVTTADAAPAAGDRTRLIYRLEGQSVQNLYYGSASAKTITISFWVKSNVTGTYVLDLIASDGSSPRDICATYTVSASGTWEKKVLTFVGDTAQKIVNSNANGLEFDFWLGAGTNFTSGTLQTTWGNIVNANRAVGQTNVIAATNNYWQITGFQAEIGSVATEFQLSSGTLAGEFAAASRYYYRFTTAVAYTTFAQGGSKDSTSARCHVPLPVQMRVAPTSIEYSTLGIAETGASIIAATNVALDNASQSTANLVVTVASGLTQYRTCNLYANNSTAAYLAFNAEL